MKLILSAPLLPEAVKKGWQPRKLEFLYQKSRQTIILLSTPRIALESRVRQNLVLSLTGFESVSPPSGSSHARLESIGCHFSNWWGVDRNRSLSSSRWRFAGKKNLSRLYRSDPLGAKGRESHHETGRGLLFTRREEKILKIPPRSSWNTTNLFWISMVHVLALMAIPLFTWGAFSAALVGIFLVAPLGINIGYHRLLTHKAFTAPTWVRNVLATLGTLCAGGPPVHWAAMHRVHHRFSDTEQDPHNSMRGFWYSHVLHLFVTDERESDQNHLESYAPDLMKEPYMRFLNKYGIWLAVAVLPALYAIGGLPWLFWAGFFRVAATWNIMWLVNSASHMWGYRNYDTKDRTKNCWWVGVLAAGEGWHNNHHAQPACVAHGHRIWEFDQSYLMIKGLQALGLAKDLKMPLRSMPGETRSSSFVGPS